MSDLERLSITLPKAKAEKIRALVAKGAYPSVSGAIDAAADALIELEDERAAWWAETLRRCKEAEEHPERLLAPEEFHNRLWAEIGRRKKALSAK